MESEGWWDLATRAEAEPWLLFSAEGAPHGSVGRGEQQGRALKVTVLGTLVGGAFVFSTGHICPHLLLSPSIPSSTHALELTRPSVSWEVETRELWPYILQGRP